MAEPLPSHPQTVAEQPIRSGCNRSGWENKILGLLHNSHTQEALSGIRMSSHALPEPALKNILAGYAKQAQAWAS
jgi:hypothetical protein